jgi:phosphoserine phosphatase
VGASIRLAGTGWALNPEHALVKIADQLRKFVNIIGKG